MRFLSSQAIPLLPLAKAVVGYRLRAARSVLSTSASSFKLQALSRADSLIDRLPLSWSQRRWLLTQLMRSASFRRIRLKKRLRRLRKARRRRRPPVMPEQVIHPKMEEIPVETLRRSLEIVRMTTGVPPRVKDPTPLEETLVLANPKGTETTKTTTETTTDAAPASAEGEPPHPVLGEGK